MAKCVKVMPHQDQKDKYLCWMEYFALDNEQIKKLRKDFPKDFPNQFIQAQTSSFKINILHYDSLSDAELGSSIKRTFPSVQTFTYENMEKFEFDYDPLKSDQIVEKDIPGDGYFDLMIDPTGHFFLEHSQIPDGETIFGDRFADLKTKDFQILLEAESKKR